MKAAVREDGNPVIYTCFRCIADDLLCICDAMYEHAGGCKKRNTKLEMADHTTGLHDRTGLCDEFDSLSAS